MKNLIIALAVVILMVMLNDFQMETLLIMRR